MPYSKVCLAFDTLKAEGLITRKALAETQTQTIAKVLKSAGFRFPNQTAEFLHKFGQNPINLKTASRDDLIKNVDGMGWDRNWLQCFCATRGVKLTLL